MNRAESGPSIGARLLALVVLLAVGYLLLKVVIGLVMTVVWIALAAVAVVAVIWALRILL